VTNRPNRKLVVGSRGSALALWQTEHVIAALKALHPGLEAEVVIIKTQGDKILDVPLARIGDRGLFVKEIEEALHAKTIDLAVHSLKDLPTEQPEGLAIAAVSAREDARDCLVSPKHAGLAALPDGAVVGTSSLRRKAQLAALNPSWTFKDVRGNLQTRLAKLDAGEYDALVLASAGLARLGLGDRIAERIETARCLPAVGQGALAVESRADDAEVLALLKPFEDPATRACVMAERALLRELEGGCQVPIGAHAVLKGETLALQALVAALDGSRVLRATVEGPVGEPEALGRRAAAELLAQGTDEILAAIRAISLP
jgi:hydroxymethylbilane synthase